MLDSAGKSSPAKWITILVVLAVVAVVAAYAFKNMGNTLEGSTDGSGEGEPMYAIYVPTTIVGANPGAAIVSPAICQAGGQNGCPA